MAEFVEEGKNIFGETMIYDLFDFADRVAGEQHQTFFDMRYLHRLTEALEQVVIGELPDGARNLAISIAPRHYKTTFGSKAFPAWCLAEVAPDCEFILTSYSATLATENAMGVKNIVTQAWYQDLYPHVRVSSADKNVQNYFKTSAGGCIYAVGTGGTVTGFGAGKTRRGFGGAIIIDDPMKAMDARSETQRKNVINYYTGTLKSRRNDANKTPFILIAQRLHPEDLLGWALKNEPEDWYVVSFPAISENGTLLNPVTMNLAELTNLKEIDPFTYWAQYMQTPVVPGGDIIKQSWWTTYTPSINDRFPYVFITADTAYKSKEQSDQSVIRAWGATRDALYELGAVWGRWEFPELLERAQRFWSRWQKLGARDFYIEDRATGTPLEQTLLNAGIPATAWLPGKYNFPDDKVSRMNEAAYYVKGGRVKVPEGSIAIRSETGSVVHTTASGAALIEECSLFQRDMSHIHDDHCDTLSMAVSIYKEL